MRRKLLVSVSVAAAAGIAGVVAAVVFLPSLLEKNARAWIDRTVAESVDAKVGFGEVGVSVLSSFPDATVTVSALTVDGQGAFEGVQLASIPELSVTVGLGSLWSGETIDIRAVTLVQPTFHVVVNEEGKANYDVAKGSEGEASAYSLDLDAVTVTDATVTYEDRLGGSTITVKDLDHASSGAATQDVVQLDTNTTIAALTYESGGVGLLRDVKVSADADVTYDQKTGGITLGENRIALNELVLAATGSLVPQGDDWAVDLDVKTLDTAFKTLLSLVPSAYSPDFAGVEAGGTLTLEGGVKGLYKSEGDHLPALDLVLKVADARFAYPGMPQTVEDIAADVQITHPEGAMDLTVVDVRTFALTTGGTPLRGRVKVANPTTDPDIDANVKGRLDLAALRAALPDDGTKYAGKVDVDLDLGGRMSAFQASDVKKVRASGGFRFDGVGYESPDWPVPFDFATLDVAFTPAAATVKTVDLKFGESDLVGSGELKGLLPYVLGEGTLSGKFEAKGKRLDLTPFEGEETASGEEAPAEDVLVAVPADLDLRIDAAWASVKAMGHELEDVKGTLVVKDGAVRMDPMELNLLGGHVQLAGLYAAPTAEKADVQLKIWLEGFDVGRTVEAFTTLGRIVPVAKGAKGRFDSGIQLTATLARDGTPDLALLDSDGRVKTFGLTLSPPALEKVAATLKDTKLSALQLDGTEIGYSLKRGKMQLEPVLAKLGNVPTKLTGGAGVLDQTMDLDLDLTLPAAALAGAAFVGTTALVGDQIPVKVGLEGAWSDPKITAALAEGGTKEIAQAVVSAVAEDLVAKAREQGDALVAAAREKADALRAEAKKSGDKLRAEAKTKGQALIKEAKGNPIKEAAAKEAAKKLDSEADKAAKKLEKEADTKGDGLVSAAQTKKDALIADAQAKSGGK